MGYATHVGWGSKSAMLGEQVRREDKTRCQETERDLKKTVSPTPHALILDLPEGFSGSG
jgi:hypothetical protein